MLRLTRHAAAVGLAAALVACGGSDASDPERDTVILPGGVIVTPGGGTDGGGQPAEGGTVAVAVIDQATGQPTNAISLLTLSQVRATVRDTSGRPVTNAVVRFDTDGGDALVFEPAPTALTDAEGVATVNVKPASFATAGAFTISAFTQIGDEIARGTAGVTVGSAGVSLGAVGFEQSPLSAYGTTVVSVAIEGVPDGTPVTVRFSSTCAAQEPARAQITSIVATTSGVARATYVDQGCGDSDLVTATVEGTGVI
ncbi:MAG: Ig-like domain-containing protein, partial [Burkholderiales bacterium]